MLGGVACLLCLMDSELPMMSMYIAVSMLETWLLLGGLLLLAGRDTSN
jgi:hypothetical protein